MALARDTHLEIIPLIDEGAPSFVFAHLIDRSDTGYVTGELAWADNRSRRVFSFDGISAKEEVTPLESETKLRRLLDYYYGGGQIRVYRMYPSNVSAWDQDSNVEGFSDIVEEDVGSADYPWYESGMCRHSFSIKGLEA